jgi:hypothetical protein
VTFLAGGSDRTGIFSSGLLFRHDPSRVVSNLSTGQWAGTRLLALWQGTVPKVEKGDLQNVVSEDRRKELAPRQKEGQCGAIVNAGT